jgi:hypothetical protein
MLDGGGARRRCFSVLEVIETMKRVAGVDLEVEFAGRREGDPWQIVAACDRARSTLKWQPQFDDRAGRGLQGGHLARAKFEGAPYGVDIEQRWRR